MHAAIEAVEAIRSVDVHECKSLCRPPDPVRFVCAALCVMFDVQPEIRRGDGNILEDYFTAFKRRLASNHLTRQMLEYDKDNIPTEIIRRITPYIEDERLNPDLLRRCSMFGSAAATWI